MHAIETVHLVKRFGSFTAVNDISLTVNEGEIVALIGPNGAGKTTLLHMLVGLTLPTAGTAAIFGRDIIKSPVSAKRLLGYVPDDPVAYEFLTGREFLTLTGKLRALTPPEIKERITHLTPMFPISDILDTPMSDYSRGNKQKISFLSALIGKPKLLIIDEPIVGMDDPSITILGDALVNFAKQGGAVLIVTHILSFATRFATRAFVMKAGTLTHDTPIKASTRLKRYIM